MIDSITVSLAFGVSANYSGLFYFDNMKLEVDTSENTWKTVYVNNFEGDTLSLKEGNQSPLYDATNANFVASLETRKNVLRVQRTRTFIGALTNVRVRWTRGNCSFADSINVQVLWTC
jgi:hypothetical protein